MPARCAHAKPTVGISDRAHHRLRRHLQAGSGAVLTAGQESGGSLRPSGPHNRTRQARGKFGRRRDSLQASQTLVAP